MYSMYIFVNSEWHLDKAFYHYKQFIFFQNLFGLLFFDFDLILSYLLVGHSKTKKEDDQLFKNT